MIYTATAPLNATLPLDGTWMKVYELAFPVKTGDIVQCYAEAEVTNPHNFLCGLWARLSSSLGGGPVAGQDIQPWCHTPITKTFYGQATSDTVVTMTFWAWAGSVWAAPGDSVKVEPDGYGAMYIIVTPAIGVPTLPPGLKAGLQTAAGSL